MIPMTESVIEKLGSTESTTLSVARETGGKIRVASLLWDSPKVILAHEVLEIRNVDGTLHTRRSGGACARYTSRMIRMARAMSSLMTDARCAATHQ
jgi:hypothetical protein